ICHDSENNTGAEIFLRIRDGKLQFGYWDTYQNHLTETAVSADTWYNAVGTYGEGVWKLYLNGELKDTEIYTPPQGINNLNVRNNGVSSGWFVGQHGTPTEQRTLQGTVSHVAVYRGVMTRPEFRGDGDSDTDGTIWKRTEDSYTQAVLSSNQADDPARSLSQQTAVNPVLSAMGITVKYSLSGNNPVQNGVNLFKINADTGEISLGRSLTSEEALAASYALTITATVQLNNAATILTDTAGITVLVIVIDLDIDSDNNNGLGLPDRSAQEELLEDHLFAPGKVILPNINDTDGDGILDCWDGYGMRNYWTQMNPNSSAAFTPIVISVPAVEIDGLHLLFTYNAQPPLPKNATNGQNAPTGNGSIRIWTKNGNLTRSVLQNYIACPPNGVYTLRQLGWVPGQTEIVLYVEGISENIQTTRTLAEQHGKPNTKITVEYVLIRNGNEQVLGSDSVNYVVAASGSFYRELMEHPELVATYAADAVYTHSDKQALAIKVQTPIELINLGLNVMTNIGIPSITDRNVMQLLSTADLFVGFNTALYREYITGKYVLAFAGTDITSFDDLQTNVQQAFGQQGVAQYEYAKAVASALAANNNFNASNTYITGHSLGGGLASAASITSGFHAYTFNAAGLHPNTVFNNNNLAIANTLIISYKVDWDILSWGQFLAGWVDYAFGVLPSAVGSNVELDSEYDLAIDLGLTSVIAGCIYQNYPQAVLSGLEVVWDGVQCHMMGQVIYGMEKKIFT
ncbi:MAG: hypothetical protein LBH00_12095, partial [Planctomycetaceae bacterium]|nr:hypothetical protein [Planctomycetaceae bacterium]